MQSSRTNVLRHYCTPCVVCCCLGHFRSWCILQHSRSSRTPNCKSWHFSKICGSQVICGGLFCPSSSHPNPILVLSYQLTPHRTMPNLHEESFDWLIGQTLPGNLVWIHDTSQHMWELGWESEHVVQGPNARYQDMRDTHDLIWWLWCWFSLTNKFSSTCNINVTKLAQSWSLPQSCRLVIRRQEDESTGAFDVWEFLKMKKSEKPQQRFLFLTSEAATLQVTPVYRYTSTLSSIWVRLFVGHLMIWGLRHESGWIMMNTVHQFVTIVTPDVVLVFLSIRIRSERLWCGWFFATEECWVLLPTSSRLRL